MVESQTTPEILKSTAQLPKGLEVLGEDAVASNLETGRSLFTASNFGTTLTEAETQVEGRQGELIAQVAGTQSEVAKVVTGAREKKRAARNREKEAGRQEKELRREGKQLEKLSTLTGRIKEGKTNVIQEEQPAFESGVGQIEDSISKSITSIKDKKSEANAAAIAAREERRAVKYREAVRAEISKLPEHLRSKQQLRDAEAALLLIDEAQETLPQYQAGLVAAAKRVIAQAGQDKPLKAGVLQEAKVLDKVQLAADGVELRLARKIDKVVELRVLGREGRFTASVIGLQERREIDIEEAAQGIIAEIEEGECPAEAVTAAADQIRVLVEKPGFGKKPLGSEFLTEEGLRQYERQHKEELIDPLRSWAFGRFERKSVEEILGCGVIVSEEEGKRRVDFKLKTPEEQEGTTPLFQKLTQCEAVDLELRRKLQRIDPTDVKGVRNHVEALRVTDKLRQSLLKLSDARINGLLVADGVRSGALKTALAEGGVKAVEGAVVAGLIYGGVHYLGARPRMEDAQAILAAPEKSRAIWTTIENLAPGLDVTGLQQAISAHAAEIGKTLASQTADKAVQLASLLNQAVRLDRLISMGPEKAAQLMHEAQLITKIGALGGIISGAVSMTEQVREKLGIPVRGIRSRLRTRFGQ